MVRANPQDVKKRKRADPRYVALRFLAIRPRSIQELTTRLNRKEFSDAQVAGVVRELIEQGLLDDAQFSHALIEQTVARKPVGQRLLQWKLRRMQVPPAVAEAVLAQALPHEREAALARAAMKEKLAELARRPAPASPEDLRARVGRFLLSRGFAPSLVREVLE
ncbi:MAG: RecX family transcriptional regulator [bacterium]|nr:RecX family transcriptional regulator [bacterium]